MYFFKLLLGSFLLFSFQVAYSQESYPSRPVKIVVGFSPGGGADLMARSIAIKLTESMGNSFIVENKPGANGNLSANYVLSAPADGYTMLLITVSHAISQSLYSNLKFNLVKDFSSIAHLGRVSQIIIVNSNFPINNMKDFVAYAKLKPGAINYGTSGIGSGEHVAAAMLEQMAGIKLTHVPFKGGSDVMAAVVSGQTESCVTTLISASNFLKTGHARALAVTSETRSKLFPDLPTVMESTGLPKYQMYTWYGIIAKNGVPAPILEKLNYEINKVLKNSDTLKIMDNLAIEPTGGSSDQFHNLLKNDVERFGAVIRSANVKIE